MKEYIVFNVNTYYLNFQSLILHTIAFVKPFIGASTSTEQIISKRY